MPHEHFSSFTGALDRAYQLFSLCPDPDVRRWFRNSHEWDVTSQNGVANNSRTGNVNGFSGSVGADGQRRRISLRLDWDPEILSHMNARTVDQEGDVASQHLTCRAPWGHQDDSHVRNQTTRLTAHVTEDEMPIATAFDMIRSEHCLERRTLQTNLDMIPKIIKNKSMDMFGAVVGDIAGSTYEADNCKSEDCTIFAAGSTYTDDSVLTLATAQRFLSGDSYEKVYGDFGRAYPYAGYGGNFCRWLGLKNPKPYNSWGNGSAMRASPIGWVAKDLDWALAEAKRSAEVTHNHPQGIKGAQAVVAAIYLARHEKSKNEIKTYIEQEFGYDLDRTIAEIRPAYRFDVSCDGSVPEAIIAFLESKDFEDAIRKAISLGGDSDTIACIAGAIAHAFYGAIPSSMVKYSRNCLDKKQLLIMDDFWKRYRKGTLMEKVGDDRSKSHG